MRLVAQQRWEKASKKITEQRSRVRRKEAPNFLENEVEHCPTPVDVRGERGKSVVRRSDVNFWLSPMVETSVGRRETGRVSPKEVQGNPST